MKVRMLRPSYGDAGRVQRGAVIEVDDARGKDLLRSGLAEAVQDKKSEAAPLNKAEPAPDNKAETAPAKKSSRKG